MGSLRTGSAPMPRFSQEQNVAAVEYYAVNRTTLTQTSVTVVSIS